ncbi:MAG: PAS domain-containing protein [Elusimicrobia bacterium]|nr:PAS domain-containing protein [Elusimicrobiota bacterium]MBD3411969.1 PAS domain-containing protein [Elusimicrobiota bacterium]
MKKKKPALKYLHKELEAYRMMGDLSILAASLPHTAFLELSLERIMSIMHIDAGGIYSYHETAHEMHLECTKNIPPPLYDHCAEVSLNKSDKHVIATAVLQQRPLSIDHIATNSKTKSMRKVCAAHGFKSLIVVPMVRHNEVLGVIIGFLQRHKPYDFFEQDVLEKMIVPLAHALESAQLFNMMTLERRKLGTILYVMNDGVCTVNMNGEITFWNRAAEHMTGLKTPDVMGKSIVQTFLKKFTNPKGEPIIKAFALLIDICRGKEIRKFEGFLVNEKENKRIFMRLRVSPYSVIKGTPSGCIIIFEDATSQWEIGRLKEDWRSMLTHDLKTPLTSTFGMLRILSDSHNLDKRDKKLLDIGIQSYHQMLSLVNLYLDVEKFNTGRMSISVSRFTIKPVLVECVEHVALQAELKGIRISVSMKKDYLVLADRSLMVRVFDNLLSNAVKSIPRSGKITIKAYAEGRASITVAITDTGVGIPEHEIPHLFDRFYQVSAGKYGKDASSGLGLTFCKQVMRAHGQDIRITSKQGKGSTFYCTLTKA